MSRETWENDMGPGVTTQGEQGSRSVDLEEKGLGGMNVYQLL